MDSRLACASWNRVFKRRWETSWRSYVCIAESQDLRPQVLILPWLFYYYYCFEPEFACVPCWPQTFSSPALGLAILRCRHTHGTQPTGFCYQCELHPLILLCSRSPVFPVSFLLCVRSLIFDSYLSFLCHGLFIWLSVLYSLPPGLFLYCCIPWEYRPLWDQVCLCSLIWPLLRVLGTF